ncbi:MAG: MAPEG family protein [Rhodocyclaceae bacterium]
MSNPLIYPMAAHLALTALLYVLLTLVRAPTVWGLGRRPDGSNPWEKVSPRISANLSNQFEWPLFFYVVCVLLLQQPSHAPLQLWLAWLFIAGRLWHTYVQICTTNVRLRGAVFTINFVAVLAMWLCWLLSSPGVRA